jgi:hypothetical protein
LKLRAARFSRGEFGRAAHFIFPSG